MKRQLILPLLLTVALVVSAGLTIHSYYAVEMLDRDRSEMMAGLKGVAQRIRDNSENAKAVRKLGREAALAKARAFARIVEKDPVALGKPGTLEKIAADLGVDELHVSDEKGVLVYSLPASYRGYDMASRPQSAAFMPAVTNADFAFVQEPMAKGINSREIFQYVGVARRDQPGIVQIGFGVAWFERFQKLTDVRTIARSTHLGRDTSLTIRPREGLPPPVEGVAHVVEDGRAISFVEMDCGEWRIRAFHPTVKDWMARTDGFRLLVVVDILLLLIALFGTIGCERNQNRRDDSVEIRATKRRIFLIAMTLALTVAVAMTIRSHYAVLMRERDRTEVQAGLEGVAWRLRAAAANDRAIEEMNKASALAKARTFARIVEQDPAALDKPGELEKIAADLDVPELHVSDGKGVLVHSFPAKYRGYDLSRQPQSAAFMPAVTNADFCLYQDPMLRGFDSGEVFRYVGVARRDCPGIVQIGLDVKQHELTRGMDDANAIVQTANIGVDCMMTIRRNEGLLPAVHGIAHSQENGRAVTFIEIDCDGWRVRVSHPTVNDWMASASGFQLLVIIDALLLLAMLFGVTSLMRNLRQDFIALKTLFGGRFSRRGSLRRAAMNPITLACAAAFLLAVGVTWLSTANTSRQAARARLSAASADMRKMVNECADNLLFYQGASIVRHYGSPEKVPLEDIQLLKDRYGLDELTVVGADGVVMAGTLADIGFNTYSDPLVGQFNCLLHGAQTFSQEFRPPVERPSAEKYKYAGVAFPGPAKGWLQLGFCEKRLKNGINFWFEDAALNLHIGERGYCIIADSETGEINSCGRKGFGPGLAADGKRLTLAAVGFVATAAPQAEDEFFEATLFGEKCLCLSFVSCFHRIVCAVPLDEVAGGGRRTVLVSMLALLAVFLLVVFFMTKLTELVTSLQEKERVEHERQLKDLTLAKTIQTSALPFTFPNEPDYKIFAKMVTALEVGGDFYDFYERPDGKIVFLVADVSGKGIPAALFMMRAKAILRSAVLEWPDSISSAIANANDNLSLHNDAEMFVTAWIGAYDRETGEIAFVNAGHNPPLIKRANGTVEWIRERSGLVLAAMGGVKYRSGRCRIEKGDSLFLYTDGVTEAMNRKQEQYGEPRLEAVLAHSGKKFVGEVDRDLAAFTAGAQQSDDITMLALDRL